MYRLFQRVRCWRLVLLGVALTAGAAAAAEPTPPPEPGVTAPTPPPPAPAQQLGEVKVVEQTPGTRTVVDASGHPHMLMNRVTPAQRKAAAARAKASREAAARKASAPAAPASKSEVTR